MNNNIGNSIRTVRYERNLTQKQLADKLNISDKTISKWERGVGYPDVSLLSALSECLGVDMKRLLAGDLIPSTDVNGNMKNIMYYVCPSCYNITLCTGNADISCCGKILAPQELKKASDEEQLSVETVEDEWYISTAHPMTKDHYISFIVFVRGDMIQVMKQYPEWNVEVRIPKRGQGTLLWYCTNHGLFYQYIQ